MFYTSYFQIGFAHIGYENLITNEGILSLLEETAGGHSTSIGYGLNDIPETHVSWAVLNWKVKILKRPKYFDKVIVKTWARQKNKIFCFRDFEVYDENDNLLIIASSKWVFLDTEKNAIMKIEDSFYNKYKPEEKSVFNTEDLEKLKESEISEKTFEYTVRRNDIDVNGHVHNTNYLSLAYEALPEDIYRNIIFDNFEILYKKEIKFNETVNFLYSFENDVHTVAIKSEDNSILHAIIKLY
jgi:medium-chain acyl-[acyl-carrier-protein] hydrolase